MVCINPVDCDVDGQLPGGNTVILQRSVYLAGNVSFHSHRKQAAIEPCDPHLAVVLARLTDGRLD